MDGLTELAPGLAKRIADADADADEPVEVVIELAGAAPTTTGSRHERIAAARSAFETDLVPVTAAITAAGGEVLDAAWLNRTVRGSVPAGALGRLAADEHVAVIDLPRPLEPDAQPSASSPSP